STPADPASRQLEGSILWHHVQPRSPSQTASQPLRRRFGGELDYALLHVPCIRSQPGGITRSRPLRVNRQGHSLREKAPRSVRPFCKGALPSPRHHSELIGEPHSSSRNRFPFRHPLTVRSNWKLPFV